MFLHFSSLLFFQIELFLGCRLFALLEIYGIDMVNPNQSEQEDTNVPSIDSKLFDQGVCIINKASLIDRNTVLRVLVFLDKAHWLQNLIEHNVVYFVMNGQVYLQSFEHSKILPNESLGCVLFIVQVHWLLTFHKLILLSLQNILTLLLTAQSISVKQLVDGSFSSHLLAFLWYRWMECVLQI